METFPAVFDLSSLDGDNGFVIRGSASIPAGYSVSGLGDINNDGIDDLIIGAPLGGSRFYAGASYIVFGSEAGFDASLALSELDGSNGFVLNGVDAGDRSGISVSGAGDINADGINDLIVGAYYADPNGVIDAGESYVVFGSDAGFNANIELSNLDGSNGFTLNGIGNPDVSGFSVSGAGDINADGIEDLIIGASLASPDGRVYAGESYVVFGSSTGFDATLELSDLTGSNGFALKGIDGRSGYSVSTAGDVNADGIDDIIIGAISAGRGLSTGGESYVVFGRSSGFNSEIELSSLDGTNGFTLTQGNSSGGSVGTSVSAAGDINGDGIDDVIVGARNGSPDFNRIIAGRSFVIFGNSDGFDATIPLTALNGSNGFAINGIEERDDAGVSVSGAGDVNGDGIDDLIVGASQFLSSDRESTGESYIIYGKRTGFESQLELTSLDGSSGFRLNGVSSLARTGTSVSGAGDINNDGIDDVVIGTDGAAESYVVFGRSSESVQPPVLPVNNTFVFGTAAADELFGDGDGNIMFAGSGNDLLLGGDGNDLIFGDGGDDLIFGGAGDDLLYGDVADGEGGDRDIFAFGLGEGTDIVLDFEAGIDAIALTGGLTFGQIYTAQSGNDAVIGSVETGEVLAVLVSTNASRLSSQAFLTFS